MAKNTIKLKKYSDVIEEYVAAGTITPGMLLEFTSAGKVQAHATADNEVVPLIALEDELQGNGIDDDYSSDDQVQCWIPYPGDEAYMILQDGQDISIGDFLQSNGDGTLKADAGGASKFMALEALDLSGSSGEEESGALGYNKRIKVKIIAGV